MLARERETIEEFVDKSDRFATTLVEHGTFGFLPDVPSAYTQPLYGWFLAALYWPFGRSWLAVGLAQIAVAVATALVVLAIGALLRSTGTGVVAALPTTLPSRVWHDVHANREVLDGLLLALVVLCALLAYEDGESRWHSSQASSPAPQSWGTPASRSCRFRWRCTSRGKCGRDDARSAPPSLSLPPPSSSSRRGVVRNESQVGCFA